ncbi:ATP-binding protein [Pseudofrankia sp. BMG5.37]|uniref:AlbA family DNA-binding domain-containing protein n=1 Tax=Pseudofrankia sp. BMG5.37 TaxID=3050035 RepID=UPI00289506FD|nr:ATP-binding protein [Pseudofrankia sp. BMG5.37]MDT3446197.1 ATP-binding protein [Pseudofrankia sp. BMG5.37]
MALLRSRRLETIFGKTADALTYADVAQLVDGAVPEADDLDYKRDVYGLKAQDRLKLAGDVAAMANSRGGLVILGMEEDALARAAKAVGVEAAYHEISRMRQIINSLVAPIPRYQIYALEDPDRLGTGFLLLEVPASSAGPHAVVVNQISLRYPRRSGSTTAYRSQHQVESAYFAKYLHVTG